jgi:glycosyltransferase involved in cell wall biosynthesis
MRILLVGNYALDNQASMSRYAEMLARHMRLRGHLVEVIRPPCVAGGLTKRPLLRKWLGYIDKYLLFPLKLRSYVQGFDLVHVCDHSNSMYLAHIRGIPSSITCHDLLAIGSAQGRYPQQRISWPGRVQQRWILRHLMDAKSVVCVSTNTARELAELSPENRRRLVVIQNAVDRDWRPAESEEIDEVRRRLRIAAGEQYLFHAGANLWYKNRLGVLRIFRMLREQLGAEGERLRLVMAGAPFTAEMTAFMQHSLPAGSVIEVVRPTDEDLRRLYSGAAALLFPSLHEGFGWPIAEAQSCGCPVITSNRPPMTEVAGGAALLIDPMDESGAAAAIAENLAILPRLRGPGLANAKRFDTEVIFTAYEGLFAGILGTRRSSDVVVAPNEAELENRTSREP